jgi:glycosyltransferase involved in cell wall biosynthesis
MPAPAPPGTRYEELLSVVIPVFNEAAGIERCLVETTAALMQLASRFEIIVVDDGSTDGTLEQARRVADKIPGVRIEATTTNAGKGSALIRGMQMARGELVLFADADLEVHPRQFELLYATLVREDADIVIGSKLHRDADIDYPLKRRVLSVGYYIGIRVLFRLPVHDTQTGLKLYRRRVLERVGPRLLVKRFAHDLEVLVNAHRMGYRIAEAPVVVTRERAFPRVGVTDARNVLIDTLAIFYRTYITRYYDRVGRHVDRALGHAPAWWSGPEAAEPPVDAPDPRTAT